MTTEDVVAWLRNRAAVLNEAADALDGTVQIEVAPERMRDYLSDGISRRVGQIAQAFGASPDNVRQCIRDNPGLLKCNERGWVSLEELDQNDTEHPNNGDDESGHHD